ncbi:MAG: hypothetical protein M3Y36_00040 [Actinomycetota bacterium]|nr:hypothetical protein [Actinomycetota bacterium]
MDQGQTRGLAGSFRSSVRFDPQRAVVDNVAAGDGTAVFVVCLDVDQALSERPAPADLTLLISRDNRPSRSPIP